MECNQKNGAYVVSEEVPGGILRVSIGYSDGHTPQADITFEPTGGSEISLAMAKINRGELAVDSKIPEDNRDVELYAWGNIWDKDYTNKYTLDYSEMVQATAMRDDEIYVKTPGYYVRLLWSSNDAESENAVGVVGIYVYDAETGIEMDGGELDVFEDRHLIAYIEDALAFVGFVEPKLYIVVSQEEFEDHIEI